MEFQEGTPHLFSLAEVARKHGGELVRRAQNVTERYGIGTGWQELDNLLRGGGLLPGLLYVVGGRPGMGKTTFMQNLAVNIARQGTPVAVFSLELSAARLLERLAYQEAGIDYAYHYRNQMPMSEAQVQLFAETLRGLAKLPIYVQDTAGMTPNMIAQTMHKHRDLHGLKVMFIDYLHIMRPDGKIWGGGREREIGTMVEVVRDTAKMLHVACVLASQLNRAGEEKPPFIPALQNLRDSGSIEQVAYAVLALYRQDYYILNGQMPADDDGNLPPLNESMDVVVLKQQDGPMGTAHLKFIDGTGKVGNW